MHQIMRTIQGVLTLTLAGVLTSPSWAQEMERPGGPRPMPPAMEELERMTAPEQGGKDKDVEERIREFAAKRREKLLQALQLDEATRTRLNQRLEQLDQKAEDLRRQQREAVQALRKQAKGLRKEMRRGRRNGGERGPEEAPAAGGSPADNNALRQALDRVYAVEDAMAGLRRERLQVARDLLTPEQQMKFLLFSARFQKEMRERMLREQR
jgi:hypothetical protein